LEVAVSTVIAGMVLVMALRTVGSAAVGQFQNAQRSRAQLLAVELLTEISSQVYREPDDTPDFGPESGETTGGTRAAYDDVDDYFGWRASPPTDKAGAELSGLTGWERSVSVKWVDPDDLARAINSDEGVKRVTVSVSRDGVHLVSVATVVTDSWLHPPYE
jgi:hypothetical protein